MSNWYIFVSVSFCAGHVHIGIRTKVINIHIFLVCRLCQLNNYQNYQIYRTYRWTETFLRICHRLPCSIYSICENCIWTIWIVWRKSIRGKCQFVSSIFLFQFRCAARCAVDCTEAVRWTHSAPNWSSSLFTRNKYVFPGFKVRTFVCALQHAVVVVVVFNAFISNSCGNFWQPTNARLRKIRKN